MRERVFYEVQTYELHCCLKLGTFPVAISHSVDLYDDDFFGLTMDDKDLFLIS